ERTDHPPLHRSGLPVGVLGRARALEPSLALRRGDRLAPAHGRPLRESGRLPGQGLHARPPVPGAARHPTSLRHAHRPSRAPAHDGHRDSLPGGRSGASPRPRARARPAAPAGRAGHGRGADRRTRGHRPHRRRGRARCREALRLDGGCGRRGGSANRCGRGPGPRRGRARPRPQAGRLRGRPAIHLPELRDLAGRRRARPPRLPAARDLRGGDRQPRAGARTPRRAWIGRGGARLGGRAARHRGGRRGVRDRAARGARAPGPSGARHAGRRRRLLDAARL
ncbi:MAG: hypothetical protein AVDCRST_MAG17-2261, partial [uncultured Solirubrobacterales bacterium]